MNWDAIGAIGEVLGAAGVIVSLLYLATQIRADSRARQAATFQDISSSMVSNAAAIVSVPSLAPLLVKLGGGEERLTPEERIRFHYFMMMACRSFEAIQINGRLGLIDTELIAGFERSNLAILAHGAGVEWWAANKTLFTSNFVSWVDAEIAAGDIRPMHPGLGAPVA